MVRQKILVGRKEEYGHERIEKKGIFGISIRAVKILLCVLLVFNALIFLVYGLMFKMKQEEVLTSVEKDFIKSIDMLEGICAKK